ncbi:MAG: MBL fold metallo-hydrolase [Deltaproteobacteria bacterium]|nr:MBL fold metallo-hydrolase [Deltaproteobacteria bacterium]
MTIRTALSAALLSFTALASVAVSQAPVSTPAPPPLPDGVPPFEVAQYNSFTWYGRFGFTNCAFIDMGDGVLVIDTGWTKKDAENLKAQIKEKTKGKPVRWIVMTQTDIDSNGGIDAFLPTDATIFVHARAADVLASGVFRPAAGQKRPTVVGVTDQLVVSAGERRIELVAAPGSAHSAYDLAVLCNDNGLAFVGDLITPGRCPNVQGLAADPVGWLEMLDRIRKLNPAGLVASRGEPTKLVFQELEQTRAYLDRVVRFLSEQKIKNAPEARVAAELSLKKLGDYCPPRADNANVLALYRRMQPDGSFAPPVAAGPSAPATVKPSPAPH